MSHQTTVTAKSSDLPVTLGEAKQHLRLVDGDFDEAVSSALSAAVEYCETVVGRSLRVSQTLTQKYCQWPCSPVRFDRQPVKSVTVAYYDADDDLQTVSASDYRLLGSSEAGALLEFDSDFSFPTLSDRADAVTITPIAGYTDLTEVPARAKQAILLKVGELFGNLDERQSNAARRACDDMLSSLEWGCYR